ncbi:DNA-directed RNA polymerase II subunit RPB1 [Cyanidiococcus yangmingshanensis]|uniref:DNA-directed RNA polymerase n=1 Tax=Cyanidiococcus yangmingshanensis TaxID=2690220 RepID=A0A7J7IGA8_9RHOD|nr:DNA-directed RNA polymerase II subunit RPB1 [Cyanidiococcus yangmingshanensis]
MHIRMAGDEYEKGALGMAGLVDGIHADDSLNLLGPGDMSGTLTSVGLNGMRDLGDQEASALDEQDDVFLKRIELALLEDMQLKGMAGIRKVFMRQTQRMEFDPQLGSFVSNPEWVLDTEGTALLAVLSHPDVDSRRTISNEVTEVLEVLGIEAARQALYNEMYAVLSFDGSSVGYRHLALLAEVMTCRGYIIPISRFGINRLETGPLMRCTFEETVEVLATAATFGIRDQCEGVSQAVILGQRAAVGTGAFSLSLDETLLSQTAADISVMGNVTTASMMAGGMSPDADAWTPAYTPGATPALSSDGGAAPWTPSLGVAMASPYGAFSPAVGFSPAWSVHGSGESGKELTGYGAVSATPYATLIAGGTSPAWAPSPAIGAIDGVAGTFSPSSPAYSPTSPRLVSPSSPAYSPTSPAYSPTSPAYSPSSPNVAYSPSSPVAYSPSSPNVAYSPSSPVAYSPSSPNVAYSPSSPVAYSPSSPNVAYSPSSPVAYSPSSPNVAYSPSSPVAYSPSSPNVAYSPSSPAFSPSSPVYSPKSK